MPYQANRTLGVHSKMFNMAEEWGLRPDGSNPTRHVKKYPEKKRERFLSPEELRELWQVFDTRLEERLESPSMIAAFKMLILTGSKLGEMQTLKWSYIQGNTIKPPLAPFPSQLQPQTYLKSGGKVKSTYTNYI
ncbi:hypothetical protein QGN29_09070 [Temperatibacter marinus]|uniref:Integrase n=1 Tax=Temperatibacter marinus TaxID=1456591 RepID=A0AA52H8C8_9PROT|nr:hypothetical protein [Temperatibacter marinus]WND01704.1 hypothetical protein QGN29_09070 [Temperatibacter marinus]